MSTSSDPDATSVAALFVEVASRLVEDVDVHDYLHWLSRRTTELLDVASVGIVLAVPGESELRLTAASDERTHHLELLQVQREDGPCFEAFHTGEVVSSEDLGSETRWPAFTDLAHDHGLRSVTAIPMRASERTVGAVNLFRSDVGPLSEVSRRVATALAHAATIGLLQDHDRHQQEVLTKQLRHALQSRVVIEQAKGALAQRDGIEVGAAFEHLRGRARAEQRSLADVAALVVGEMTGTGDR